MNVSLNILITTSCAQVACEADAALMSEDRQGLRRIVEAVYAAVRDDLAQHAAPDWLEHATSAAAAIHAVCMRIAGEIQRHVGTTDDPAPMLHDAAVQAVACICLTIDDEEEAQLDRTMAVMKRHARASREIADRLAHCPTLTALSPHLRDAIRTCVSDRIDEFASMLVRREHVAASDIGGRILDVCPPSSVQPCDLATMGLDGRRDRRGVDLAAGLVLLCAKVSAHALGAAPPDRLRGASMRIAAAAMSNEPALEPRFRARLLAIGRIGKGEGE